MVAGIVEGGIALVIAASGALVLFGQIKNNAERNAEDIETIKRMIEKYQQGMQSTLERNMFDMKELLEANKSHQAESLSREVMHLKDLINISNAETRADIQRLESEQKESNNLKTKLAIIAQSVKSLHKRLDVDVPPLIDDDN